LLAGIDRHGHRVARIGRQHVDQVEHPQRVERAEDHRDHDRRPDQRQRDLEEHPHRMDAVTLGGFVAVRGQHLQAGEDQQRHERRCLPDIDHDHRPHGGIGVCCPGDRLGNQADAHEACR
jgi:hypothetical protein